MINKQKSDLNKDGDLSSYEKRRGMAIAKAMADRNGAKKGGFIQKAIKKPGALRKSLGVKKGKTIPAGKLRAAAKKSGKLGQRARLAITLKKLRKK